MDTVMTQLTLLNAIMMEAIAVALMSILHIASNVYASQIVAQPLLYLLHYSLHSLLETIQVTIIAWCYICQKLHFNKSEKAFSHQGKFPRNFHMTNLAQAANLGSVAILFIFIIYMD